MKMQSDLSSLLAPRSVAVLGASDQPAKPGGRPIAYLKSAGFAGAIYPVNPARSTVQGFVAYPSLESLPEAPDLVVIAVAATEADAAIEQCIRAGARAAVMYTAGFAETGADGAAVQQRLAAKARAAGLRLLGPNTQGIANFSRGAVLNFSGMLSEFEAQDGPIAVISQSGAGGGIVWNGLRRLGLGVRYLAATGNEADVDIGELAEAVVVDPQIKLILLYLESIRNPAALARAGRRARELQVPIVAVKAGRTRNGQLTASSHTGALATEDAMVDAFLRQAGILRVNDLDELVLNAQIFACGAVARGDRVVSISNSGAACVMAADAAESHGLPMPQFDETTTAALAELLPGFVSARNPVDMSTALYTTPAILHDTLQLLQACNGADLVHLALPAGVPGVDFGLFARVTAEFMRAAGIPVAVSVSQDWVAEPFRAAGVPVFRSERAAMSALALSVRQSQLPVGAEGFPAAFDARPAGEKMDEAQSLQRLARAGLPVVDFRICATSQQIRQAFAELGGPVVVKGLSKDIPHKSEHGLVKLGIQDGDSAAAAGEVMQQRMRSLGVSDARVLVARQECGDFELSLGAHVDPLYGPVVMVGQGGVLVEAIGDVRFLVAPFNHDEAIRELSKLHVARCFGALRALEAVNVGEIADLLVKLGRLVVEDATIASFDANPLIVRRGAQAPVIVDALIQQTAPGAGVEHE